MHMREDEKLTDLIGNIYDAALDSALWTDVLATITEFAGAWASGLLSKDSVSKVGKVFYGFNVDSLYTQLYEETYWKFDPLATLQFFDVEQIVTTQDLVPYDEFLEGRFYQEWARPQGLVDAVDVILEKSPTSCAYLTVMRHESRGMVDDEMRRRMRLVIPHVRRAVLIGKTIDLRQAEAQSLADALDGLSAGMILVDADGRIAHANAAGHVILSAGDFLRATAGRLVADDAQADEALREIFTAAGSGDAAVGIKGIALPLMSCDGVRYVAHVLPLTSGRRRSAVMGTTAAAALFVHKAALETPSPPEIIAKTFKLTPTELRVLLALVEVGGAPEVAEALGIAGSTVKTHLGRLFEKTGVGRQADLVKLVAGFSNSLIG
jgi:DNA-binding CsgD family transcriptional regulator/PAS domain-containing protein